MSKRKVDDVDGDAADGKLNVSDLVQTLNEQITSHSGKRMFFPFELAYYLVYAIRIRPRQPANVAFPADED